MSSFENAMKKCKSVLEATAVMEGNPLKGHKDLSALIYKDTECDVLVIKGAESCSIGLMLDQWIFCYEFKYNGEFLHYEPMTRKDLAWALSPEVTSAPVFPEK